MRALNPCSVLTPYIGSNESRDFCEPGTSTTSSSSESDEHSSFAPSGTFRVRVQTKTTKHDVSEYLQPHVHSFIDRALLKNLRTLYRVSQRSLIRVEHRYC